MFSPIFLQALAARLLFLALPALLFSTVDIHMNSTSFKYLRQHEPQVFRFWEALTKDQQTALENQSNQIQLDLLKKQKQLIEEPSSKEIDTFDPFDDFAFSGNADGQLRGQKLIEEGRLGCLLLAGGQGTRLHYEPPKGTYPISVIKQKSLFQLCAEKVKAASLKANRPLHIAIMTSPENDEETRSFFLCNGFFGLDPSQISFFIQGTLPLLDAKGRLFLQTPWQITSGADGNGHSLLSFAASGILDRWIGLGIKYLHVILVDNPLADPFDPELLGFHQKMEVEMTLKCTEKVNPEEKIGVLVKQNGRCGVVEYSEISHKEKNERRQDGRLKHCCGNLSLFCFSLSFIQHLSSSEKFLPLHKAWKAAQLLDDEGNSKFSTQPIAWKFETFIFDWLNHTQKAAALIYPREECFAPLKNSDGPDSPKTVQEALQKRDRDVIQALTGLKPPDFPFELAADFYYPTPALSAEWKGKPVTTSYVEPE